MWLRKLLITSERRNHRSQGCEVEGRKTEQLSANSGRRVRAVARVARVPARSSRSARRVAAAPPRPIVRAERTKEGLRPTPICHPLPHSHLANTVTATQLYTAVGKLLICQDPRSRDTPIAHPFSSRHHLPFPIHHSTPRTRIVHPGPFGRLHSASPSPKLETCTYPGLDKYKRPTLLQLRLHCNALGPHRPPPVGSPIPASPTHGSPCLTPISLAPRAPRPRASGRGGTLHACTAPQRPSLQGAVLKDLCDPAAG